MEIPQAQFLDGCHARRGDETGVDGVRQRRKLFEGTTAQKTIEISQFFSRCILGG